MLATSLFLALCTALAGASLAPASEDPRVQVALVLDTPCNGVSATPDGRLFVLYARVDGSKGPLMVEWNNATRTGTPYPDEEWNSYAAGKDPASHFVRINAQRVGPDGALWLVDVGATRFGEPVIYPGGPKLVQVNLTSNAVQRVYPMGNVTLANSLLDDVRFNPAAGMAYVTDAGEPALIVVDLVSGRAARVLEGDRSTRAFIPSSGEGTLLRIGDNFAYFHADQLEVSPDGRHLYYEPASGGLWRVETRYLDAALYNASEADALSSRVEPFARTPATAGTAIDAAGTIYNSDTDRQTILSIAPNGTMSELVRDPRLLWADAMWIDGHGKLWVPAAQVNRGVQFQNGTNKITKPLYVFTIDIGVGPSAIDHA